MSRRLARLTIVAAVSLMLLGAHETAGQGLQLSDWGIRFPDGSELTSATGVKPANVLIVAKSGGHFTSIQAALDAIGGSIGGNPLPEATEENPYLVWVAPGVYEEQVTMKEWVDIQGSGEGVTKVTYTGTFPGSGTVVGASNSALRLLTVESRGGAYGATGVFNDGVSPQFTHITVTASSDASNTRGIFSQNSSPRMLDVNVVVTGGGSHVEAVYCASSSITMTNVTAIAEASLPNEIQDAAGISSGNCSLTLRNVTAEGSTAYGDGEGLSIYYGDTTRIEHSRLKGSSLGLAVNFTSNVFVASTMVEGGAAVIDGFAKCIGTYDEDFEALDEHCQPIP